MLLLVSFSDTASFRASSVEISNVVLAVAVPCNVDQSYRFASCYVHSSLLHLSRPQVLGKTMGEF